MKTQQQITKSQLLQILSDIDGKQAMFVSLTAEVDARLKKTDNKYAKDTVTKLNKYSGLINYNYANSVNNQRLREDKEADFKAKSTYANKINDIYNGCLATHNTTGQVYLVFKEQSSQKPTYKINGKEVDIDTENYLKQFRVEKKVYKSQDIDKQVEHRNIKLENIKTLNINNIEYIII